VIRGDRFFSKLREVLINGESFRTYVEKMPVLTLKPGDIVTMDNLAASNRLLGSIEMR
jgi:hypothetical protein